MRIDPQTRGNQFYPDIDANAGRLHAVWQDTRASTATGPDGSWITVPFENQWVPANPPGAVSSGPGVQTFYATAAAAGGAWTTTAASSVTYKLNWEQFGNRDVPFFGDYNYVSAVGSKVLLTWTDGRNTVAGTDPRYTNGDGTDGFDVLQCRTQNPRRHVERPTPARTRAASTRTSGGSSSASGENDEGPASAGPSLSHVRQSGGLLTSCRACRPASPRRRRPSRAPRRPRPPW